jgi:sugar phosphate permease
VGAIASPPKLAAAGQSSPPVWLSSVIWSIAALFYLTGFYQRVSLGVMTDELMRGFGISAAALGTLSAFYYYAYVAMQIPTGMVVDSWGARRLLIWGAMAAALGTFLFGLTSNFALACVGRAIIGAATAVAWVVSLKLATHWFAGRKFAMLSGLGLLIGNLGAIVAQIPLRLLINRFEWREVVLGSAVLILVVGVLAFALVKNDPSNNGFASYAPPVLQQQEISSLREVLDGFRRIWRYRNTWLIFLGQGAVAGSILTFTGLWGTPYLRARFGLKATTAAAACTVMIVCWAAASPLCGALSDRIGRRKPIHFYGCLVITAGWLVLFYLPGLSFSAFVFIGALVGLATGGNVLGFAYAKESVPIRYLGTASGLINMGNMAGPMFLQPAIGWALDKKWTGGMQRGVRMYDVHAFHTAFLFMIGWLLIACVLFSLTRETYCKNSAES